MADYLYFFISSAASGSGITDYAHFNLLSTSKEWDGTKKTFSFTPSVDLQCFLRIVQNGISVGENNKIKLEYDTKVGRVYGLQERFNIVTTKQRYSLDKIDGISVIDKDIKKQCIYLEDKWYSDGKPVDILNPLYKYGADPDFIKVGEWFYIVASQKTNIDDHGAIVFIKTKDWQNFESVSGEENGKYTFSDGPIENNFWAPDIKKIDNKYIIYIGNNSNGIFAYSSENIDGPYRYEGVVFDRSMATITDSTTIDQYIAIDQSSRDVYMFFGSFIESYKPSTGSGKGKCYAIKLKNDGLSIAEGASPIQISNLAAEGTNIFYKDGFYYQFASRGAWGYSSYHIVMGRCASLVGEYVDKEGNSLNEGNCSVLVSYSLNGRLYGIGHNGSIFKDYQGRYFMVAHAWDRNEVTEMGHDNTFRKIILIEIKWDEDGWPFVDNSTEYLKFPAPILD